jgi:hypothetical protein
MPYAGGVRGRHAPTLQRISSSERSMPYAGGVRGHGVLILQRIFSSERSMPYAGGVRGRHAPEPPAGALPLDPKLMLIPV